MAKPELTQLRIKIRSLADEARVIRSEERKAKTNRQTALVNSLCLHRTKVVRPEARCALLCYAFLRGMPYERVEQMPKTRPDWRRIRKMIERFSDASSELELLDVKTRLEMWIDGA